MFPKRQIFLVLGLSRSGKAATDFLLSKGAITYIYDDLVNDRVEQVALDLQKKGAKRVSKAEVSKMQDVCDVLVLSPGIPIDHPMAVAFKRNGKAVIGEAELAARNMRCPIIAVTGTNGKTTTVSMLAEVLNKGGYEARACGNIGAPMTDFCTLSENSLAVAEISSFQLETLNSLDPHIAMILNITEDHLNRHYNMENYIFLKGKLLKNLSQAEYAILNYDDPLVRPFSEKTKANVLYFSVRERVRGAFYEKGDLYFGKEKIMSASDLPTEGIHNIQNALAVIVAAKIMGVKTADIVSALTQFKGIRHRIETIGEVNGVLYVDDSKGTNVDATIKAVAAMKAETILLLGGKDKGYDYNKLFTALDKTRVIHAVLYGENRYALFAAARKKGFENITLCDGFTLAVQIASLRAQRGQTVLLSPASASFDEFSSYEERGEKFAQIVRSLAEEKHEEQEVEEKDSEVNETDEGNEKQEEFASRTDEEME